MFVSLRARCFRKLSWRTLLHVTITRSVRCLISRGFVPRYSHPLFSRIIYHMMFARCVCAFPIVEVQGNRGLYASHLLNLLRYFLR